MGARVKEAQLRAKEAELGEARLLLGRRFFCARIQNKVVRSLK